MGAGGRGGITPQRSRHILYGSLHLHVDHVSSELDVRSGKAVLREEEAVRQFPSLLAEELVAHVVSPKLEALQEGGREARGGGGQEGAGGGGTPSKSIVIR